MSKRRCTALTKNGRPCRAWATPGSEPPRCASHGDRLLSTPPAPDPAEPPAGFFSRPLTMQEEADLVAFAERLDLADEIGLIRIVLRRLLTALNDHEALTASDLAMLAPLTFRGASTVAQLLRDQRALSGEAAEGIAGAIGQALSELGSEWGITL